MNFITVKKELNEIDINIDQITFVAEMVAGLRIHFAGGSYVDCDGSLATLRRKIDDAGIVSPIC